MQLDPINNKFPSAEVSIPPDKNAKIGDSNHILRNHNLELIDRHGRMNWQRQTQYGKRNVSELAMQRYKRIIGRSMLWFNKVVERFSLII